MTLEDRTKVNRRLGSARESLGYPGGVGATGAGGKRSATAEVPRAHLTLSPEPPPTEVVAQTLLEAARDHLPERCVGVLVAVAGDDGGSPATVLTGPDTEDQRHGERVASLIAHLEFPPAFTEAPEPGAELMPLAATLSADSVVVPLAGMTAGGARYRGVLALVFDGCRPDSTHAVLGEVLVLRAGSVLARRRLSAELQAETERVAHLETALASNREIGVAMGIAMANYRITSGQAFDLLRRVSQSEHRKLRDVASDVARTGYIASPDDIAAAPLRSV